MMQTKIQYVKEKIKKKESLEGVPEKSLLKCSEYKYQRKSNEQKSVRPMF